MAEWLLIGMSIVVAVLNIWGIRSAYNNGVTDGYGYCREPWNPGYNRAGMYLRKHMNHRWRELRSSPPVEVTYHG